MGILFVWPIKGAKLIRAAHEAGFAKSGNIHGLRVEGANKPGLVAKIARALADAGSLCVTARLTDLLKVSAL